MICTITSFDNYSGNFEDSQEAVALKTSYLKAAQEVVANYLRFDPETEWNQAELPELIGLTILRIATLMLMEGGENIGVSSKSFADNSRQFIQYTNYNKYLSPLLAYRKAAF